MKRILLAIVLLGSLWLACPFSEKVGTEGSGSDLLVDPQVGLSNLDNYHASLTIAFAGTQAGQSVSRTDTYAQTEWPHQAAIFTWVNASDVTGQPLIVLTGAVGDAQYYQPESEGPCQVDWGARAGGPSDFRIATLLPAIGAAKLTGEQTLDGIPTQHYTLDATSLGLPGDATASGETWIARDGGYVMKYVLDISGADSMFGQGIQGTRHLEYALSEVNAHAQVIYPAGCEPVLTDIPAMDDASDLTRLPGLLAFSTGATQEEILSFYLDKLTVMGWTESSELGLGTDSAVVSYTRADANTGTILSVETEGSSQRVTLIMPQPSSASSSSTETTPGAQATALAGTPSVRVVSALNFILAGDSSQGALPSYHLVSSHQRPVWTGGTITQRMENMTADVQGKNVHFVYTKTSPGGAVSTNEVYLIGEDEYDVVNGQVQPPGASLNSLAWAMWPLDPVSILAVGATGAAAAGTEVLDGRTAEVYTLNGTSASLTQATGIGLPVTSVTGTVWIDQQTGALLKAVLDYQADVTDNSGVPQGSGAGHMEIMISQIGSVTVALP